VSPARPSSRACHTDTLPATILTRNLNPRLLGKRQTASYDVGMRCLPCPTVRPRHSADLLRLRTQQASLAKNGQGLAEAQSRKEFPSQGGGCSECVGEQVHGYT